MSRLTWFIGRTFFLGCVTVSFVSMKEYGLKAVLPLLAMDAALVLITHFTGRNLGFSNQALILSTDFAGFCIVLGTVAGSLLGLAVPSAWSVAAAILMVLALVAYLAYETTLWVKGRTYGNLF